MHTLNLHLRVLLIAPSCELCCQRAFAEVQWTESEQKTVHMVGHEGKVRPSTYPYCTCILVLNMYTCIYIVHTHVHVLVHVNERCKRKEGRSKQGNAYKRQSKATQHTQGVKAVNFPNELHRVGFEPTALHTLDKALYQLSYQGSSAGWAQILRSHSAPDEHVRVHVRVHVRACRLYDCV